MTLRFEQVRYTYPGARQPALDGIDLVLDAGRVLGVVGPNEAGKSTLCLLASGLAPGLTGGRLEGRVTLGGTDTRELKPHEAAQRCGILFQNAVTQLSGTAVTVFEEVAFGPRNLGLEAAAIVERVEWALAALDIASLAERDPQHLSGGQAQLVALASVLALRPAALALDEPTSQLDPAGTRLVGEALRRLASETGAAILLVEHKTDLVEALAADVVVLDAGLVVRTGPAAEVLADPILEEHGVAPPSAVAIRRAATEEGVADRLPELALP